MSEIQNNSLPDDQFSFKDIVIKLVYLKNIISKNWKLLILTTVLGIVIGYVIEKWLKQPKIYVAKIVFNMENGSNGGGGGGLSDLASALGFSPGSTTGGNLFSGENFIELLKTKNLYNRALLTRVNINGKSEIFANYYLRKSGVPEIELKEVPGLKEFNFIHDNYDSTTQNERGNIRLIQNMLMPYTMVSTESKKSSFLTLSVTSRNDTLSYTWAKLYLKIVTDFYKETKTQKTREVRDLIVHRVDSLKRALYGTQNAAARYADQNQQIVMQEGLVQQQRLQTNIGQLQGMYFEAVRNLDNINLSMAKETPLFTKIDDVELPISAEKDPTQKGIIIGGFLGLILSILYVAFKQTLREIKS